MRIIAAVLLVQFVGCQSWQPTSLSARDALTQQDPSAMRVTRADGAVVTIPDPIIRNDSIVPGPDQATAVLGVPTSDVNALEVRRFSGRRSLLLAGAIIFAALGWAQAVDATSGGSDVDPGPVVKDPG